MKEQYESGHQSITMNSPMIADSGALAHVTFRVRCETLGHGEEVFLVKEDDVNLGSVSFEVCWR